ncbi:MAG: GIY-YIG nuclease family protein [Chloroflexota bacterium]
MGTQIGILDLLKLQGFDTSQRFKFVRHKDARFELLDWEADWLEAYQSFQHRPVFDGVDSIVVFLGIGGTRARFMGVYRVLGRKPGSLGHLPEDFPKEGREWLTPEYFYYEMEKVEGFEEFAQRVIIEWGKGAIRWHQWGGTDKDKEVVEVLPKGNLGKPFDDYLTFTLTHRELESLCERPEANMEWRTRLSAVAGVYLILDTKEGQQYVGSAYGAEGIWGRWEDYAKTRHGGNKRLKALVDKDDAYPGAFQYSILQVLPTSMDKEEVIRREGQYKKKLGTRVHGLNTN